MKLSVMLSRLGPKLILLSQDAIFAHIVPHLDVNYEAETQMNSNGFRLQDLESQRSYPTPPFEHIFQPMPSRRSSTLHGMKKINFEDSVIDNFEIFIAFTSTNILIILKHQFIFAK